MATLELEKKFLSYLLKGIKWFEVSRGKIQIEYLEDEKCKVLYDILLDYYGKYLESPTKLVFETLLNSRFSEKSEMEFYLIFATQLRKEEVSGTDFDFVVDSIINTYLREKLILALNKVTNTIDKKDIREIYEELSDVIADPVATDAEDNVKVFDLDCDWEKVIEHYDIGKKEKAERQIMGISTGIEQIDRITGGWRPGELIVIVGSVGAGKSLIKLNLAQNAYESGANVLFVTLEMSWGEVFDRRHSLVTGIDFGKIRNRVLTSEEEKEYYKQLAFRIVDEEDQIGFLKMFDDKFTTNFDLASLVEECKKLKINKTMFRFMDVSINFTTRDIESVIKKIQKKNKLDLVVIDYINIMQPSMKTADNWFNYGSIARELKLIARNRKVSILTSAQMGEIIKEKGSDSDPKIKTKDIKYAKMISDHADFVLGFNVTEADKINGIIRLQWAKGRNIEKEDIIIKTHYNTMKIETFNDTMSSGLPVSEIQSSFNNQNGQKPQTAEEILKGDKNEIQ